MGNHEPQDRLFGSGSVRYPEIQVELSGEDGNAFSVMGAVKKALKKAQVSKEEIDRYMSEAMGGDYNHLLATTMRWVNVS